MTSKKPGHIEGKVVKKPAQPATTLTPTQTESQPIPGFVIRRAQTDADSLTSNDVRRLQGVLGNKAIGRRLANSVQRKEPKSSAGKPLGNDELVLTWDPKYTSKGYLGWFRKKVKGHVVGWGFNFKNSSVGLRKAFFGIIPVIALKWDNKWGSQPASFDILATVAPMVARLAVAGVKKLSGWAKVKPDDQAILENMLGGEANKLSEAARKQVRKLLPGLKSKSKKKQAKILTGLISAKKSLPGVVDEPVTTKAVAYKLTGPTTQKDYQFHGKKADAEVWVAKYDDGIEMKIMAPKAPTPGFHNHSVEQVAKSGGYLPKVTRKIITSVDLNPIENPEDPHWATEYNTPGFHSYMTAGVGGVVTIYPNKTAKPMSGENYMRGTMIHETGHTWAFKNWGTDVSKGKWLKWKQAMNKDKVSVSGYAMASISEDVAETIQIYVSTKGSTRYAEYRRLVPNRFIILDKEYK